MKRFDSRAARVTIILLPVLVFAFMGYCRRWMSDDAFIDLRVVQHIFAGHGPVFNIDERVEAYTSPLWVGLLAIWGALGGGLEMGAVTLGIILSVAGLLLAQRAAWHLGMRLQRARDDGGAAETSRPLALPLGAAVFSALPIAWDFSTSGLESGLVIGWLGAVFWLLARARPAPPGVLYAGALAIGCGPLVRPDLGLFSVGFAIALGAIAVRGATESPTPWRWCGLATVTAILPLSYQIFRMGYFAALVPNTAFAKEAGLPYWSQGLRYTFDFVVPYALWFPLLVTTGWTCALLAEARRERDHVTVALILAPTLAAGAHWMYVTRVGGDFMHGRFLLPTLFGFLLPVAIVIVRPRSDRPWAVAGLAGVVAWALVCAVWLRVPFPEAGIGSRWGIADERRFYEFYRGENPISDKVFAHDPAMMEFVHAMPGFNRAVVIWEGNGMARVASLSPSIPPPIQAVVGMHNIGTLAYLAGLDAHVVDLAGLADPIAGRLQLIWRGRPGHEKSLPVPWVIARFGDESGSSPRPRTVADAARALQCGGLAHLLQAVDGPLTGSQFLQNLRDAWALSSLRIPRDPTAARARFCGDLGAPS
jgi:arabinofuranosyltransferase